METEKALTFLDKYNYIYSVKGNTIFVKLEFSQRIRIEFNEPHKIIIKDKLVGWNFLTGLFDMSLKNALIYNLFGSIILGSLSVYSGSNNHNIYFIAMYLIFMTWAFVLFTFYLVKLESFKIQILNWINKQ